MIPQRHVECVKNKRAPKISREREIHHVNTTKALSQTFGAAKHFIPKNSEGDSKSTKYTRIKSEYVGNLAKIKLLGARIMTYYMRDPFIIPTMEDDYAIEVKDRWRNRAERESTCCTTG